MYDLVCYTNNTYWDQSDGLRQDLGEIVLMDQYKHPEYVQSQLRGGGSREARTYQGNKWEDGVSVVTPLYPCHPGITCKDEIPLVFPLVGGKNINASKQNSRYPDLDK